MKKIFAVILLLSLLLGLCACADESGYDQLYHWLEKKGDAGITQKTGTTTVLICANDGKVKLFEEVYGIDGLHVLSVTMNPDSCEFEYIEGIDMSGSMYRVVGAAGRFNPTRFKEDKTLTFDTYQSITGSNIGLEDALKYATAMLSELLETANEMTADSGVVLGDLSFGSSLEVDYRTRPFGERLAFAGQVTLVGMLMIFAVLALLWGVIEVLHVAISRGENKKKKTQEPPVAASVESPPASSGDDGALVAAITAAVAAYLAAESGNGKAPAFRVVSFKRTGNGSAWNQK